MQHLDIPSGQQFMGFDHVDVRVSSLGLVEKFYDRLMPLLGLTRKRTAFVDSAGEWLEADSAGGYNTVEYFTPRVPGAASYFIGFIEHPRTRSDADARRISRRGSVCVVIDARGSRRAKYRALGRDVKISRGFFRGSWRHQTRARRAPSGVVAKSR